MPRRRNIASPLPLLLGEGRDEVISCGFHSDTQYPTHSVRQRSFKNFIRDPYFNLIRMTIPVHQLPRGVDIRGKCQSKRP